MKPVQNVPLGSLLARWAFQQPQSSTEQLFPTQVCFQVLCGGVGRGRTGLRTQDMGSALRSLAGSTFSATEDSVP